MSFIAQMGLGRTFRRTQRQSQHTDWIPARTGRIEPNGSLTLNPTSGLSTNRIWVRKHARNANDPGYGQSSVWNTTFAVTTDRSDTPVWIGLDPENEYEIKGLRNQDANNQLGAALTAVLQKVVPPELYRQLHRILNVFELRPYLRSDGDLGFKPGWINGLWWDDSSGIDPLTFATAASDMQAWVLVYMSTTGGTLTLDAETGADKSLAYSKDRTDIETVIASLDAGRFPMFALLIRENDTTYNVNDETRTEDLRDRWMNGGTPTVITRFLDFPEIAAPADPVANFERVWAEDNNGITQLKAKDSAGRSFIFLQDGVQIVRNVSGSTIAKLSPVQISGASSGTPTISLSDADAASAAFSHGVTLAAITNNSYGLVQTHGIVTGQDTSAFAVGNKLYVSATGTLTATKPAAPSFAQWFGTVLTVHATTGTILLAEREEMYYQRVAYNTNQMTQRGGLDIRTGSGLTVAGTDVSANNESEILISPQFNAFSEESAPDLSADFFIGINAANVHKRYAIATLTDPFWGESAIVNGAFRIAQLGTSFVAAGQIYTLDNWEYGFVGTGIVTITQSTDVPAESVAAGHPNFSLKVDVTTADSSIAATDFYVVYQRIEGYNFAALLAGRKCVLSFWVKSTTTGIHCVSVRSAGADRSFIAEYTVNVSNTWERKTILVDFTAVSGGTWDYTTGYGVTLLFTLAAGSNSQQPIGWNSANAFGTSGQTNVLNSTSNDFLIHGVDFRPGVIVPRLFVPKRFDLDVLQAYRYYEKLSEDFVPGSAIAGRAVEARAISTQFLSANVTYRAPKRISPTVTIYSLFDGAAGTVSLFGASANTGAAAVALRNNRWGFSLISDSGVPYTVGSTYRSGWIASAR